MNFSASDSGTRLSVNISGHPAVCFALGILVYTDRGFAVALEPPISSPIDVCVPRTADSLGCPVKLLCQPTPGRKQSPGDAPEIEFEGRELLRFPGLPVLFTIT